MEILQLSVTAYYSCYFSESRLLTVGALQVQCIPTETDGVDRLAMSRGLLTCCRPHILLASHADATVNIVNVMHQKWHALILIWLLSLPNHIISVFSELSAAGWFVSSGLCFV